jgi:hypothetical protein
MSNISIVTKAALAYENRCRTEGLPFPKLTSLLIDSGDSDGENIAELACEIPCQVVNEISTGVIRLIGSIPPDIEVTIKGVAAKCVITDANGIETPLIYCYQYYYPERGGYWKGKKVNLQINLMISHQPATNLNFSYVPIDVNQIIDDINLETRTNYDQYAQGYFLSILEQISSLQRDFLTLTQEVAILKTKH